MRTLLPGLAAPSSLCAPSLVCALVAFSAVCWTVPAACQVTTNQGALDALGSTAPAAARTSHRHGKAPAAHAQSRVAARTRTASAHPPSATIPAGPPPPPVFRAAIINVPLHPPPPPPPVPVVQTAIGTVTPIDHGIRITFGPGSADLNPAMMQALHGFSDRLKADPLARADLDATSSGAADDPSTPRRTALSRGLAARAVLIGDGIASTRIYVRVLGQVASGPDASAPADRVDLLQSQQPGLDAATPTPPGTAPASSPGGAAR